MTNLLNVFLLRLIVHVLLLSCSLNSAESFQPRKRVGELEMLGITHLPFGGTVSLKENQSALRNTASSFSHPCLQETCFHRNKFVPWMLQKLPEQSTFHQAGFQLERCPDVNGRVPNAKCAVLWKEKQVVFVLFCFFNSKRPE